MSIQRCRRAWPRRSAPAGSGGWPACAGSLPAGDRSPRRPRPRRGPRARSAPRRADVPRGRPASRPAGPPPGSEWRSPTQRRGPRAPPHGSRSSQHAHVPPRAENFRRLGRDSVRSFPSETRRAPRRASNSSASRAPSLDAEGSGVAAPRSLPRKTVASGAGLKRRWNRAPEPGWRRRRGAQRSSAGRGLLPVPSVEGTDADLLERSIVEAAQVHAVAVGVRARHVEGLDAAVPAEEVTSLSGVEGVGRERVLAPQQPEVLARHDQVQVAELSGRSSSCIRRPRPRRVR